MMMRSIGTAPLRDMTPSFRRLRLIALALAAALTFAAPARADFDDGWKAFEAGDYARAKAHWMPLARAGDLDAMYNIGALYENGFGVPRSTARAIEWYRRAADRRFAPAQFRLGQMYASGLGLRRDAKKALHWYERAAEQGYPEAAFNLAVAYETGVDGGPDIARAVALYSAAVARGFAPAQFNLGRLYALGQGVPRDIARAVALYRAAAEQGYAPAQNNLGYMYEKGIGVAADTGEAVRWYRRAAEQGFATAQTNLGILLAFGTDIRRDLAAAARWFRAAALTGDGLAQANLGLLLANGQGVARDPVEAYAWLLLAAESNETGASYRDQLAARLDDRERLAGARRAAALRKQIKLEKPRPVRAQPRPTAAFGRDELTVQRYLKTLGLYAGAVDGMVGGGTRAAIRAFQRRKGLRVDGRITPALIDALAAAVRAQEAATAAAPDTGL